MVNFKPIFIFNNSERVGNAQVFATREEAHKSAQKRFNAWTMPTGFDVDETSDPVNYRFDDNNGDLAI